MVVCAKCGTDNPKGNKFCKECGAKLGRMESIVSRPVPETPPAETNLQPSANVDVAVGELLYQTFQFYETGNLDEALANCKDALRLNPESTSGHSLLAMIYEKKSELAAMSGLDEAAKDYILSAMRQHERVLEFNPDSVADAEKLRELKRKVQQNWDEPQEVMTVRRAVELSAQTIREVPMPVIAGVVATLAVLVMLLFIWSNSGQPKAQPIAKQAPGAVPSQVAQGPTSNNEQYIPPAPRSGPVPEPQFIAPQGAPTPAAQTSNGQPSLVVPSVRISPRALPPVAVGGQPAQRVVRPLRNAPPVAPVAAQPPQPQKLRGSDYQIQGMDLARQNKSQDAITAFKHAINAYQDQIKAGDDIDSANAGIRTCKHYIEMLEN